MPPADYSPSVSAHHSVSRTVFTLQDRLANRPAETEIAFRASGVLQTISQFAPSPRGYSAAFRNQNAATSQANYMGFYVLESYNTTQCGEFCSQANGCVGFNIYFERDPTLNPAPACPNPLATNNIKCSLWGSKVSRETATNEGQYREQFHVIIAGSDGFNKA